jgi:hypothetical protein
MLFTYLGNDGATSCVADLASLLVAASVVDTVGELVLEALGSLVRLSTYYSIKGFKMTNLLLDLARNTAVGGVASSLTLLVGQAVRD